VGAFSWFAGVPLFFTCQIHHLIRYSITHFDRFEKVFFLCSDFQEEMEMPIQQETRQGVQPSHRPTQRNHSA
jgi:hypothetical protein